MLGAIYVAQVWISGTPEVPVRRTGGGGWSHRGPVQLPVRKPPQWKPKPFKKLPPPRW